jgi:hypothetical protein
MSDDRRPIEERVGTALASGDMRQREGACDLDKVGALGMIGIKSRLADAVYRLKYANEHRCYDDALQGVYGIARSLDVREHWRLRRSRLRWMSKRVLDYWLADLCRICLGVKYETVHGSPHLSDRVCPMCHGSGKNAMPWVKRLPRRPEGRRATHERVKLWREVCKKLEDAMYRHRRLLVELEAAERQIGEQMIRKLADRVREL